MILPRWYKKTVIIWAVVAPSFWWFATAFNGLPFFSLPSLNRPSDGDLWQIGLIIQLGIMAVLLAPFTTLPFAIKQARNRPGTDIDNAQD